MSLLYCFEKAYIKASLAKCKRNDLAVVDTNSSESLVKDALKTGSMQYCRYDGGRASTSLRPCQINGWSILDSIGGRVTHRSEKTDDGVVIVEVTEQ